MCNGVVKDEAILLDMFLIASRQKRYVMRQRTENHTLWGMFLTTLKQKRSVKKQSKKTLGH